MHGATIKVIFVDVLLTVRLSIILVIDQLNAQIIFHYMFRALSSTMCSKHVEKYNKTRICALSWSITKIKQQRKSKHTFYVLCSVTFFFVENRAVYEIMWKNTVQPDWSQMTIRRMRIACWIPKATNTLGICNTAFPQQQWFHGSASMSRFYAHCLYCSRKF